jgi:hypothetical protein
MEPSPQLWWSLYQEAKQWQAGIAALLGFLGLIVAALWNFHLNRRRDARIRAQETRTVASALYGEILLLRNELAALAEFVAQTNQMSEADKSFYTPSSPILYPALAEKVGLLPANLLLGITKFYAHVDGARRGFEIYYQQQNETSKYSVLIVLEDALKGVQDVKPVLRMIERLAAITEARDPDTGRAEDLLVVELSRYEANRPG